MSYTRHLTIPATKRGLPIQVPLGVSSEAHGPDQSNESKLTFASAPGRPVQRRNAMNEAYEFGSVDPRWPMIPGRGGGAPCSACLYCGNQDS